MTHSFDDDDKEVLKIHCDGVELTEELLERFHASACEQFLDDECDCPKKAGKILIESMRSRLAQVEAEKDRVIKPDVVKPGFTLEMAEEMYEAIKDLQKRIANLEDAQPLDIVEEYVRSQMQDDETYEDARLRVNDEFDYLNTKGKSNPLEGDEYIRYKQLTKGLGKS